MSSPILITCFEPFAGRQANTSQRLCTPLLRTPSELIAAETLPVDFEALREEIPRVLDAHRPRYWIMLGEQPGISALHCERVAVNLLDSPRPDNRGVVVQGELLLHAGPDAYFTTLGGELLARWFNGADIPAQISDSAGTYACNMGLYLALHFAREVAPAPRVGFVHIPRRYRQLGATLPELRRALLQLAERLRAEPSRALSAGGARGPLP